MATTYDICLTGATGFVGSHVLYDLLMHTEYRVLVLVRGREADARERLLKTLKAVPTSRATNCIATLQLERLSLLSGDIVVEHCGVSSDVVAALRGRVRQFWHAAASLKFEDQHRAEIRRVNVQGTANALELATSLVVERFVYMSTAYVCGRREGEIPEQLVDPDSEFNNEYERSKCAAEHLVSGWRRSATMRTSIVRPSIIVGPRQTYAPGGSDTGLYGFIREIQRVRNTLRALPGSLVLEGEGSAPLNFVPVDEVSRALLRLDRDDFAGGPIFHLTSDLCPNVATTLSTIARQCCVCPIEVTPQRTRPATPVERVLDKRARFYRSYLSGHRRFLRNNAAAIEVSDVELRHYVGEYVRRCRQLAADQVFASEVVEMADGLRLTAHTAGDPTQPALVIVNAFGMPVDFWAPLARMLAPKHYVIAWDLRGTGGAAIDGELTIDAQLSDMARVFEHYSLPNASLVGWCSGADLALEFARRNPGRVSSAVFVNGAFCDTGGPHTSFRDQLQHALEAAAESLERAQLYYELIYQRPSDPCSRVDVDHEQAALSSMLQAIDPDAMDLASLPFRSAHHLHHYARVMTSYWHWCHDRPAATGTPCPTLVIGSGLDHVIDPSTAKRVARRLCAELLSVADGTHFAHYDRQDVIQAIGHFVARSADPRPVMKASHGESAPRNHPQRSAWDQDHVQ